MESLGAVIILPAIVVALLVVFGVIKFRKHSDEMFVSRIDKTLGSVRLLNSKSWLNTIDVHTLGPSSPPQWIGLTFNQLDSSNTAPLTPVTLSRSEAVALSKLLADAAQSS